MKKFIIFFLCVPLVYSELHRFMTAYTVISGQTAARTPEFSAVMTLDDQQIYYNDSNIKKPITKRNWMKEFTSTHEWKEYMEIREKQHQTYKNIIPVLMQRFSQSEGVHTCQLTYGCVWDDETGDSQEFDQHTYDGEDLNSPDLKENRSITPVPQATTTAMKWNNDKIQLIFLKQYYDYECVYWLKELLHLSKAISKKADPPKVSLLQKYPDYYVECHVTGFLFRNTSISWRKNGQALSDPSNLTSGDTLPNEDGTFQRRVTLYVLPDERKEDQYTCVVEHKSLPEPIQKILTEDQIMRNKSASDASYIMHLDPVIILVTVGLIVLIGLSGLCVLWKCRNKLKAPSKKTTIYFKSKPSQEHAPAQDTLLSIPSNECSSPPEARDIEKTPYRSKSPPSPEYAQAQKPLLHTLSNERTSSTEACDSPVSSDFMFLHKDEQNPSPESSHSQFLTGGPISPTLPDN